MFPELLFIQLNGFDVDVDIISHKVVDIKSNRVCMEKSHFA
jgi:hypothetical protein